MPTCTPEDDGGTYRVYVRLAGFAFPVRDDEGGGLYGLTLGRAKYVTACINHKQGKNTAFYEKAK